jgi:hypothetical protein
LHPFKVGSNPKSSDIDLRVIGYCDLDYNTISKHIAFKQYNQLQKMKGEFTLVSQSNEETVIITSLIGAMQYFYYYDGISFCHSDKIINIIKDLNLKMVWDWESLGDLCELENLTQNRTLHRDIKRVPAGSLLVYNQKLRIWTTKLLDVFQIADGSPIDAVNLFNEETARWAGKSPILSLSGGFDSRVILSSMLKQGIYPTIVTLGNEENSDMKVAQEIAKNFSLEHIRVQLSLEDLMNHGEYISTLTNGSKPACHWHTFLYPKMAGISKENSFFVGTLGEFARSYYFDKGFLSLLNDGFSKLAQQRFWLMKLLRHRTFFDGEIRLLCKEMEQQISPAGVNQRAYRNASLSHGDFLSGGTRYYLEQRVPHFYANGISMYNDSSSWRSPFHNIKWLEVIWNLCDHWKLGSNWHRLAIFRNFPKLLDFPEEKGFSRTKMLRKAPPLYWLPIMQRLKYNTYDLSSEWYTKKLIHEFILDNRSFLDEFVDKKLVESIIEQHLSVRNRTRAISFMLTVLYFKLALSKL